MGLGKRLLKHFKDKSAALDAEIAKLDAEIASIPAPMRELYADIKEKSKDPSFNPYLYRGETDVAFDSATKGDLDTVKWYFTREADRDASKQAILEAAARGGQYEVAKFVLESVSFKNSSPYGGSYESSSLEEAEKIATEKGYANIVSLIQEHRTQIAAEIAKEPKIVRQDPLAALKARLMPPPGNTP